MKRLFLIVIISAIVVALTARTGGQIFFAIMIEPGALLYHFIFNDGGGLHASDYNPINHDGLNDVIILDVIGWITIAVAITSLIWSIKLARRAIFRRHLSHAR